MEDIIYQNEKVTVTKSKFIVGTTTYSLRNISSVQINKTNPKTGCLTLGLLPPAAVFAAIAIDLIIRDQQIGAGILALVFTGFFVGIWLLISKRMKPTFHLIISTSSGDKTALSSKDNTFIMSTKDALEDAMAQ